jgi:hypothetical protein
MLKVEDLSRMVEQVHPSISQLHEPSVAYKRNTELPTLFGDTLNKRLREQTRDFQEFLLYDIWVLSQP